MRRLKDLHCAVPSLGPSTPLPLDPFAPRPLRPFARSEKQEAALINLDSSIIWAIVVFLTLVFALNRLLFRPLLRVQGERESRTTGLAAQAGKNLDRYAELLNQY